MRPCSARCPRRGRRRRYVVYVARRAPSPRVTRLWPTRVQRRVDHIGRRAFHARRGWNGHATGGEAAYHSTPGEDPYGEARVAGQMPRSRSRSGALGAHPGCVRVWRRERTQLLTQAGDTDGPPPSTAFPARGSPVLNVDQSQSRAPAALRVPSRFARAATSACAREGCGRGGFPPEARPACPCQHHAGLRTEQARTARAPSCGPSRGA